MKVSAVSREGENMIEILILILFLVVFFKLVGLFLKIFGKILGIMFSLLGYIILGVVAVYVIGFAFFVLPVIILVGIISILAAIL